MTAFARPDDILTGAPDGGLRPGDDAYVEAATTMIGTGEPDLIVQPNTAEEAVDAVRYARDHGLPLTVRAGGHSVAGLTRAPDGLLLDLRHLRAIEVDPATRLVRVDGGATWGQVAAALRPHGLGLTAGDTSGVGVGGLTLGGGIGWMVRRHGLAIDSLVGAEVITADGRILQTSPTRHSDLFWALCGGGGNFGVVTRFDFVTQPVSDVVFGTVMFALDDPLALLTAWREHQHGADERLTTVLSLVPAMGDQAAVAMLQLCFAGAWPEARAVVDPLLGIGTVLSSDVTQRPYAEVLTDAEHPPGMRFAMSNVFLPELDASARTVLTRLVGSGVIVSLRALGGAVEQVKPESTAFAHRFAEVMAVGTRLLTDDSASDAEALPGWGTLAERGTGSYINFLSEAGPPETAAAYPAATLARLSRIKSAYDPGNVFRRTVNVHPGNECHV